MMPNIKSNSMTSGKWSFVGKDIHDTYDEVYDELISCDKKFLLENQDKIADIISTFGRKYNLRHPHSVLGDQKTLSRSIKYFLSYPYFLSKHKLSDVSFKNKIINVLRYYRSHPRQDLNMKQAISQLFMWISNDPSKINFLWYIDYICNIKRNRPDLIKILSKTIYDEVFLSTLWDNK